MSAFKDIFIDIQNMVIQGMSPSYIARILDVPMDVVYDAIEILEDEGDNSEDYRDDIFA